MSLAYPQILSFLQCLSIICVSVPWKAYMEKVAILFLGSPTPPKPDLVTQQKLSVLELTYSPGWAPLTSECWEYRYATCPLCECVCAEVLEPEL